MDVQRCEECNHELSYCGREGYDGPELDCLVCKQQTEIVGLRRQCEEEHAERVLLTEKLAAAEAALNRETLHAHIQSELAADERGKRVSEELSHSRTSMLLGEKLKYVIDSRNELESKLAWMERLWQTACDNEGTQWADDIIEAAKEECP